MSIVPQIVHVCNHVIETHENKLETIELVRGNLNSIDELPFGIVLQKIYSVYTIINSENLDYHFYYKNTDYKVNGTSAIEWISNNKPTSGATYYMECYYILPDISEYEQEDCPRCLGNGWYVDLMPQSETSINELTGASKIVQDFIKIVFTYRFEGESYGTTIVDYVGQTNTDPEQTCSEIASLLSLAGEKYKELQMTSVLDGNLLSDDEILEQMTIESIEYDEEDNGIYAIVSLYSRSGIQTQVGIGT